MASRLSSLFSIGEDFDDEDILGTDWGTRSSSSDQVKETTPPATSSSLRASSVSHQETEKNCPQQIGSRSAAQFKCTTSRTNSAPAGQTAAFNPRHLSSSSPLSSLNYAQTNLPVQQNTANTTELQKPSVPQDDFDDWEFDLADLDDVNNQLVQPAKSTTTFPQESLPAASSLADALLPSNAAVTHVRGGLREVSRPTPGSQSCNQKSTNELRNISCHFSDSSKQSLPKTAFPSGISMLSRFAFNSNESPPSSSSSESLSREKLNPYQATTLSQSPRHNFSPQHESTAPVLVNALRPLNAAARSGFSEISRPTPSSSSCNQTVKNGLRNISNHININNNQSRQNTALPNGINNLSRFAFNGNSTPPSFSSGNVSESTINPSQTTAPIQSPRPPCAPQSPGVFPGLTAASPCLRRAPETMQRPMSTPVSSKLNRSLFESASPAPPARSMPPSPLHTPVLTNRLVQLVSASNSKKRPRSDANRARTRRFPGPAGLLLQQPQGQNLDDIVVSVPNTPAHGAVARSPSQCSSSQTEEEDFTGPAWRSMKSEMGLDERNPSCFLHTYSVVMVMRKAALKQLVKNKVPNMAVLLKSLVPTHTDAKAVFKDPTGEMQGTVHRRLLEDRAGELKAGAVLLLKQVGVFSPSHRNHYLNVTPNNLLRVYSPDGTVTSSSQLPPLVIEPMLLSSTPNVLREPVSKMQLVFDDDDDDEEEAAGRSTELQESLDQSTKHLQPTSAQHDSGWGADDLDELLGELPEEMYAV